MLLSFEKEVLGIYISGHPLEEYMPVIKKNVTLYSKDFHLKEETGTPDVRQNQRGTMAVVVNEISVKFTKTDRAMAFVTGEDLYGTIEIIFFPDCFDKYRHELVADGKYLIRGHASVDDEKDATFIADELVSFTNLPKDVWVRFADRARFDAKEPALLQLFEGRPSGRDPLVVYLNTEKQMKRYSSLHFTADDQLIDYIRDLAGEENVSITSGRI